MSIHRRVTVLGWALALLVLLLGIVQFGRARNLKQVLDDASGVAARRAATSLPLAAQAPSPLAGTWKLNVAKSKFEPSNLAAKSGTTKFTVTRDGITAVIDGVDAEGKATHQEYTATLDGKDSAWKGTIDGKPNPNQDGIAWRKIDDYTYEIVNKLKGQTTTTSRIVIARDGKTRTNTVTGKNAQGQVVNNVMFYEKQ